MRLFTLAIVCLMLAGCAAATPTASNPSGPGATQACSAKGGRIQPVCRRQTLACVLTYADAGKACRGKADCQGRCLYQGSPPADAGVIGKCQANSDPCGCFTTVEDGKLEAGLCVD